MRKLSNRFVLLILACILAFLSSCTPETGSENTMTIDVYFIDGVTKKLQAEKRTIPKGDTSQILESALSELVKGPATQQLQASIPENVNIIKGSLNEDTITIDLSAGYYELSSSDELYLRASLVYTLTDLSFISGVRITIEGEDLKKENGETVGLMRQEDIIMDEEEITSEPVYTQEITLYFSDDNAMGLVAETREIEINPNQPLEKYIVEQVIAGPEDEALLATVPKETKVRDVETRDNICYVDLSNDFLTKLSGGSSAEGYAIFSIVNSLTEISSIRKVQFLIDGEKPQNAQGHYDLSTPIDRDENFR